MARMMHCGYPEKHRVDTLVRAFRIYDKMIEEDKKGIRPMYRPKDWNVVSRRKKEHILPSYSISKFYVFALSGLHFS